MSPTNDDDDGDVALEDISKGKPKYLRIYALDVCLDPEVCWKSVDCCLDVFRC